ncbi:Holliday junction resolvase RuvX [Brachybacterium huguangmaarense]
MTDAARAGDGPPARHVRLGVDVGDVRVGLARSDLDGLLATPVETLPRETAALSVARLAAEEGVHVIMVGLPRSLDGREGPAAAKARDFCAELLTALDETGSAARIRLIDERLTTVSAHQALHGSGRRGRKHRSVVDQVAAVMILQQALDAERATGRAPGEALAAADGGEDTEKRNR